MIKSLIFDYGLSWVINRTLYSMKLKMIRAIPITEKLFEKKVEVKRLNIFKMNVSEIENFLSSLPENEKNKIIHVANNALNGKIIGFSSIELDYGREINWHYHPLSKKKLNNQKKWYSIPDFDYERGDIKVIWEASRFTHFFYFARAYMITKDIKYYKAFSKQLDSWIKANPYSFGANYKCGQEATLRMINSLLVYSIFNYYNLITKQDLNNLQELVKGSYKKVLSNFFYAKKCIKNNHTLSEICGLIIGSWCCEDNTRLVQAYNLMDQEIAMQFTPDGGYIQNSFNYQRLALQIMECVFKISEVTKIELSDKSKDLILNSAHHMYEMQVESGDLPNRGSNDGALIFPVTSCKYRDFRPVINTINVILRNERLYESGIYDEEILWFTNKNLQKIPIKSKKRVSVAYYNAGIFSLRNNKNSFLMAILKNNTTRPSHMDQLHIDLWHKGINVLCDNGSYSYADPIGRELTLTSSHNTVKVDELEQMNKRGPFFVTDWSKSEDVSFTDSFFKGTMISRNGYKHTRSIEKKEKGYKITDLIKGKGEKCKFFFHTPCEVKLTDSGINFYYDNDLICKLITNDEIDIKKTYRSLYYLKKEEINCVVVTGIMKNGICTMQFDIELT